MSKRRYDIIGTKIVSLRSMTEKEMANEGWHEDNFDSNPVALELSNGTILYPSRDSEGNGGGALFGYTKEGQSIGFH